jgi:hypothetical protein
MYEFMYYLVYVFIYVCMFVFTYVFMYVYMYVDKYVYMYACMHGGASCLNVRTFACIYVNLHLSRYL